MKLPRVSLFTMMAVVVVVAVDCIAVRSVESRGGLIGPFDLILWIALPMVNLLAVGFAAWLRRPCRRPFLHGFLIAGSIVVGASVLGGSRIVEALEASLEPIVASLDEEPSQDVFAFLRFGLFPVLFFVPQLLLALLGGVVGCVVSRVRQDGPIDEPRPNRHRLVPLFSPLILVVLPVFAMEGYFRWTVDPACDRLATGSTAIYDPDFAPGFVHFNRLRTTSPLTDKARVRIDDDDDGPNELGTIQFLGSPRPNGPTRCVRQIRVTLLDGPRAGESTWLTRCLLLARK